MKNSTFDQFWGTMTGGLIGAIAVDPFSDNIPPWIVSQLMLTEQLLENDEFSLEKWQFLLNKENYGEIILTIIPLLLLIQDDDDQWQTLLKKLQNIDNSLTKKLIYVSYGKTIITLALRQKLNPTHLIEQLLLYSENLSLTHLLITIQTLLAQKAPLSQVIPTLQSTVKTEEIAIALALYSFCSTPEDNELCVQRLAQSPIQRNLTCGLTATLVGVYNGFRDVPLRWKMGVKKSRIWEQMKQKTPQLWEKWAGVYQLRELALNKTMAIASPLVMQPRSTLSLISYKETLKFPSKIDRTQ